MNNYIVLQGKRAAGKDTAALYIKYLLSTPIIFHCWWVAKLFRFKPLFSKWKIVKYADSLKKVLSIILNVEVSKFEDRDFKEHYYFDFNAYKLYYEGNSNIIPISDKDFNRELKKGNYNVALEYTLTIRQILQYWGTEICRHYLGDKLWINTTLKEGNLIISDQRFKVENESVQKSDANSFIIHIIRPNSLPSLHSSEKELDELYEKENYDVLIENDSTLEDLFYKCRTIIYNFIL